MASRIKRTFGMGKPDPALVPDEPLSGMYIYI